MKITIPDIGDFEEVAVIEVLAAVGDIVAAEDPLITLESDKATMDVPSPAAGRISAVLVAPGDKVRAGTHIADLEESTPEKSADKSAEAAKPAAKPAPESETKPGKSAPEKSAAPPAESASPQTAAPQSAPDSAKTQTPQEVRVPDIGDFQGVAIIEILIKPGDTVAPEDSMLTLESDKATMDVPAPFGGIVREVKVAVGDKISAGDLIALIAPAAQTSADSPAKSSTPQKNSTSQNDFAPAKTPPPPRAAPPVSSPSAERHSANPHASPSVRKFARELGAELQKIKGSGKRGRILKTDVQSFIKNSLQQKTGGGALPVVPPVDFSQFGEIELRPLPRIRKLSAANLSRNWLVAPHVTQCAEADITDMEEFRKSLAEETKKAGYRMTPLAFFIRAAVMALREFPDFNVSLHEDGEQLVRKKYFNIGFAADTPGGLVVPVLRGAERKGLTDIARELGEIAARAREGKLKSEEMQGGCFTISSLGGIGGTFFTPIINLPEAAIMGISRSQMRPQWNGKEFVPRLILPLSLSYDHRVIDGAAGARFITYYANLLGDTRRLAL
ncbi:MAG: dihydrolipoyllysine-residue acetyltransferase [Gammaproteobacteria bacterium]